MSSITMFFQMVLEEVSPVQEVVQGEPSLKTSPGAGATGVTSARTTKGVATKTRNATKVFVENIFLFGFFWSSWRRGGRVERKRVVKRL